MATLNPARKDYTFWKGATFERVLTLYTGATTDTAKRDLTGYTATMEIKDEKNGSVLFTLSTGNSRITLGGAAGTITLKVTAADTSALAFSRGVYDLTITAGAGGNTDAVLYGAITVDGV